MWTLRPAYLWVYVFQQNVEPMKGVSSSKRGNSLGGEGRVSIKIPKWESQGRNAEQPGGAHPRAEAGLV